MGASQSTPAVLPSTVHMHGTSIVVLEESQRSISANVWSVMATFSDLQRAASRMISAHDNPQDGHVRREDSRAAEAFGNPQDGFGDVLEIVD